MKLEVEFLKKLGFYEMDSTTYQKDDDLLGISVLYYTDCDCFSVYYCTDEIICCSKSYKEFVEVLQKVL